ncbi:MAG: hypothetical protein GTN80_03650, partial [Nitrososphaeria archaeon]|nr:hypothetical protein [Nitrososphaeria archaeon]
QTISNTSYTSTTVLASAPLTSTLSETIATSTSTSTSTQTVTLWNYTTTSDTFTSTSYTTINKTVTSPTTVTTSFDWSKIPGYPLSSIIIGLIVGASVLAIISLRRLRVPRYRYW